MRTREIQIAQGYNPREIDDVTRLVRVRVAGRLARERLGQLHAPRKKENNAHDLKMIVILHEHFIVNYHIKTRIIVRTKRYERIKVQYRGA